MHIPDPLSANALLQRPFHIPAALFIHNSSKCQTEEELDPAKI